MKIGILGGGLTGLTLANLLHKYDIEVLEGYCRPGGLCRSFEIDGFRGDYGGHILFSKNKEVLDFLVTSLQDNVHEVRRENRILFKGSFVKYPFENDLASIPAEDRYECLYHFLYNEFTGKDDNLEKWIYATFGKGIAEKYLIPYNRKIWKIHPGRLSKSWVERIPKPPKEDVIKSALGILTEGYKHQLYFKYPVKGGIESLIRALAADVKVTNGFRVKNISRASNGWSVYSDTGESREYDRIISTIPIIDLFNCLENVNLKTRSLVGQLRYNSIIIVLVCLSVPRSHNFSAIYIPDADIIFHRVCYMDYFSNFNSPEGCSSLLTEITFQKGDELGDLSDKQLADLVVEGLVRLGLIKKIDVINVCVKKQEYGYVVNDLGYEERLHKIHEYLQQIDLPFCGRFAEFRYLNMDDCVSSAFKVAHKIFGA